MTRHEMLVNDVHSHLNATAVRSIHRPTSIQGVRDVVLAAGSGGHAIAIAGGRHAMGGQQFGRGLDLLDMTGLDGVLDFDPERGEIEAEAGIMWPALIAWLHSAQEGQTEPVGHHPEADRRRPSQPRRSALIERSWPRAGARADRRRRSRLHASRCGRGAAALLADENRELFRLAIGGYGLFGPIVSVRLRLVPRQQGPPRGVCPGHRRGRCGARSASEWWPWLRRLPVCDRPGERRFPHRGDLLLLCRGRG